MDKAENALRNLARFAVRMFRKKLAIAGEARARRGGLEEDIDFLLYELGGVLCEHLRGRVCLVSDNGRFYLLWRANDKADPETRIVDLGPGVNLVRERDSVRFLDEIDAPIDPANPPAPAEAVADSPDPEGGDADREELRKFSSWRGEAWA